MVRSRYQRKAREERARGIGPGDGEQRVLNLEPGTSNLILFHTDLMDTFGTISIEPLVGQTAYGVFSDLVSVSKSAGRTAAVTS